MRFPVLPILMVLAGGCASSARVVPTETVVLPTGTVTLIPGVTMAALSPDGRYVLYSRPEKDNTSHIYVASSDGAQPRRVTNLASEDYDPAWSPDGKRIILIRALQHRPYSMGGMVWDNMDVWMINTDGSAELQLTNSSFYQAGSPHFSPDQRMVVFWAYREAPSTAPARQPGTSDVAIADIALDGRLSAVRWMPTTAGPGGDLYFLAENRDPSFGPDGSTIVFVSNRVGRESPYDYEIWLTDSELTKAVQLTHLHTVLSSPEFAPNGQYILFTGNMDQKGKTPLWRIKPDGSGLTRLR